MSLTGRLKHAWNAFSTLDTDRIRTYDYGTSSSIRPDRVRMSYSNERSIISSIYARLAIDVAAVAIKHVRLDDKDRYLEDMNSGLNNCLTVQANVDQPGRALRQDIALSLVNEGSVAIVAVDTTLDPRESGGYDIQTIRVGNVLQYFPQHVSISLYNEKVGRREEITLPKSVVAIVENPFYTVMNEPNSTLQRLIRKLNLLDGIDEQAGAGKLDLIIQLPYVVKSEQRKAQAEQRRTDIEFQLKSSKYGIAYTDGTEKVTQLNRPVENTLMPQIEYLTKTLYGQLGLTEEIMNGTAEEKVMLAYWNRTVEPIVSAIVEAMHCKFLTKTARSQKQAIMYFRDPFKLVAVGDIAEIADKLTRNEVLSSNEIRQTMGFAPSQDPKADELRNSNMPESDLRPDDERAPTKQEDLKGDVQNGA